MTRIPRPLSRLAAAWLALPAAAWCLACGRAPTPATAPESVFPAAAVATAELGIAGRWNQFVSLAAEGQHVAVAWAATDAAYVTDIHVAVSIDGGTTFGHAVRVNAEPGDAVAHGEQPPRVALVPQSSGPPAVVVAWFGRRAGGSALLTARSDDGGLHFSDATVMTGTDQGGERGWHAMDVGPDGQVRLAWLDHRRVSGTLTDTVAMAQESDLYFAAAAGDPAPRAVTPGVCYCCKTAMAHGPDGAVSLAWRHVYPGDLRDIAFTTSRDGGRTFAAPVRVSEDHWSIAACPDDGPAMAVDEAGRTHLVWPTMAEGADGLRETRLFHAMTTDGRTFTSRLAVPHDGPAHHPRVAAVGDDAIVVAWDADRGGTTAVFSTRGRIDDTGVLEFAPVTDAPVPGQYPVVVAGDSRIVTAWTARRAQDSVVRVAVEPAP